MIRVANQGSVDDVRCALQYIKNSDELKLEIEYEKLHKNRSTDIKLLEAKIKKLKR